jgi:hypothetical protein
MPGGACRWLPAPGAAGVDSHGNPYANAAITRELHLLATRVSFQSFIAATKAEKFTIIVTLTTVIGVVKVMPIHGSGKLPLIG